MRIETMKLASLVTAVLMVTTLAPPTVAQDVALDDVQIDVQVEAVEGDGEGRIIRILPRESLIVPGNDLMRRPITLPGLPSGVFAAQQPQPQSDYMIGVGTGEVGDTLRVQLDIDEGTGLVVASVVEESPAAEAGLKEHDVMVTVDGEGLTDMEHLVEMVDKHGKDDSPLTIGIIRRGESISISVTPTKREAKMSAQLAVPAAPVAPGQVVPAQSPPPTMMFRDVGPTVRMHAHSFSADDVPSGVSIGISKKNDEPAKITVKRNEETWEIIGDDKEALAKLPDDLRPMVEQMLSGQAQTATMLWRRTPGTASLPVAPGVRIESHTGGPAHAEAQSRVERRLQEMERMIREMQKQIEEQQ